MSHQEKIAVVAGSTGLVGSRLLVLLATAPEYSRVVALARRPLTATSAKVERRDANFEHLETLLADLADAGDRLDVYCCLGTTLRAAGARAAFRRVDHDYVLAIARWAERVEARRFLSISALGADARSRVFYNRVKGETERALQSSDLRSLVIARPSLLEGDRAHMRLGEQLTLLATRPLRNLIPARVRPIGADDVAAALLLAARDVAPPSIMANASMQGAALRLARTS